MNPLFSALSQTWPARAVKSLYEAAKHPGEVYAGRADPMDVEKATDLAGLAMTGGLGGLGGMSRQGVVGSGPIRAYHGSPHDFDRFDLSKIGTGEGAQAYGHGLYFAENEGVARNYRDVLSAAQSRAGPLSNDIGKLGEQIAELDFALKRATPGAESKAINEQIRAIEAQRRDLMGRQQGRMYEVAIHADPERFLDWDAPLGKQSDTIKQMLRERGEPLWGRNGMDLYSGMRASGSTADITASQSLREAGIPGIKYLDQGSRMAGDGSRNYVTFSDNIVEILRKYGLVGSLGGLGGMQAMQEPRT